MDINSDDLLAIIYSEFDNHVGPQLRFAFPANIVNEDHFEAISDFVILEKHLCEQLILVSIEQWKVIVISVAIENPKYERNSLTFSFGFVLSHYANHEAFGKILRRIVTTFVDLEVESEFLFQKQSKHQLLQILPLLFNQLKDNQSLFLLLSMQAKSQHCLALKLYRTPTILVPIEDYDVPIFYKNHINLAQLPYDISFQYLILSIDGVSHVKKIIQDVNMDSELVKKGLSLLMFYQVVVLTDIFKFSNIYQLNNDYGMLLLHDSLTHRELAEFMLDQDNDLFSVTNSSHVNHSNPAGNATIHQLPILPIIDLLLDLSPGKTIGDVILENVLAASTGQEDKSSVKLSLQNIDFVRLLAFAQMKGIIRRIHEYPIYLPSTSVAWSSSGNILADEAGISMSPIFDDIKVSSPPMNDKSGNNSGVFAETQATHRPFAKLSRSKTVIGKSLLKENGTGSGGQSVFRSDNSNGVSISDILYELDGRNHLDYICCKYELNHVDIVNFPGVQIICKRSKMNRCKDLLDLVTSKFLFSNDRILLAGNSSKASVLEILHREYLNTVDGPSHFVQKFVYCVDGMILNAVEVCCVTSIANIYVVAAGRDDATGAGIVKIFQLHSRSCSLVPIFTIHDAHAVTSLSYCEEYDLLIFSNNFGEVIQFNLNKLIQIGRFQLDPNGITKIRLTHFHHLACLGNSIQSSVQIVDFREKKGECFKVASKLSMQGLSTSQKSRLSPTNRFTGFSSLDTHPDQNELVLGCYSGHVLLWDVRNNRRLEYQPHASRVTDVKYHPIDSRLVITSSIDGTIVSFDSCRNAVVKSFGDNDDIQPDLLCDTLLTHNAPVNGLHVDANFSHILAVSTRGCFWRISIN